MNDLERQNLLLLSVIYKNICINIEDFCDFLDPFWDDKFNSVSGTSYKNMVKTGLYGHISSANIWISKIVSPGDVRVSNEDISSATKDESKWSPSVVLKDADKIKKVFNLKAFW